MSATSVAAALAAAAARLAGATPSAALDARVLLGHCLARDAAWLVAHGDAPVRAVQRRAYDALIARRAAGEPVAYITGTREFWSLTLGVNADVLIPRPETELLVERALAALAPDRRARVLDLGTGSGAVALAIAHERPACAVTASDSSAAALDVAAANARRCGIDNVRFVRGCWFDAVPGERFELVVANPPYVADGDPHLRCGDLRFEPRMALAAGEDGLRDLRNIAASAAAGLTGDGQLMLEHGPDQGAALAALLTAHGFRDIVCVSDHAGLPRVTECRAPA